MTLSESVHEGSNPSLAACLPLGVTVAQLPLEQFVGVRIPERQYFEPRMIYWGGLSVGTLARL